MQQRDACGALGERAEQHVLLDEEREVEELGPTQGDVALQVEPDVGVVEGEQVVGGRLEQADDLEFERAAPLEHRADFEADGFGQRSTGHHGDGRV